MSLKVVLLFCLVVTVLAIGSVKSLATAQPAGNETLGIAGGPTQPSSHGAYGTAINFLPQEDNANSSIVFSINQDGWDPGTGVGVSVYFFTIGISVDNGSIYRVTESNRLNRTLQQLDSYNFSRWVVTNYHVTDLYNVTFSSLSAGEHQVTVYLGNGGGGALYVYIYSASSFVIESQVTPTPTPNSSSMFTASLAESDSSLYFGNTVNFMVTVNGGKEPYRYNWNIDNQTAENTTIPYFSLSNLGVGEHHVFVDVTDADNSTATTLTVAFNLLPNSNSSLSPSPTIPEFPAWLLVSVALATTAAVIAFSQRKFCVRKSCHKTS